MAIRSLKRSVAHCIMEIDGITQINKKKCRKPESKREVSFFSLHWKDYLNPKSIYRKNLTAKLQREAARQTRVYGKLVKAPWPASK